MTHDEPPIGGELVLTVPEKPVSQQSSRTEKDRFAQLISEQVANSGYLLSGDVKIWIEWYVHEQDRYESDAAPDVDNILKPLLDALCGPQGLLIDDCQVQEVGCNWLDSYDHSQSVEIRIKFFYDEFIEKEGLCFVHLGRGLCFPVNLTIPPEASLLMLEHLCQRMEQRKMIIELGNEYYRAKYIMPIQRFFHRSRVRRFPVAEIDELKSRLTKEIEPGRNSTEEKLGAPPSPRSCPCG
jgi:Holliday junction resolvase RusA-like endonuclease